MSSSHPVLERFYSHSEAEWNDNLDFPNTKRIKQFTHRIFNRYPARSISVVPRSILEGFNNATRSFRKPIRVLDPFMGSGTTAVEAVLQHMLPYGVELDGFARLISNVRVRAYSGPQLKRIRQSFEEIKRSWRRTSVDPDLAPKLPNVSYWFDETNFGNLLRLKCAIYKASSGSRTDRDFFRIVLADIIRPCSKAERQTLKPYISTKYIKTPGEVGATFEKSFHAHYDALEQFSDHVKEKSPDISWVGDDGTRFNTDVEVDVAITSPPYINALDYVRCIKLESTWVDCGDSRSLSELRKKHVGDNSRAMSEVSLPVRRLIQPTIEQIAALDRARAAVVAGFFEDMYQNLLCTYAVLRRRGEYHLIVGDSIIRGTYVPTHEMLAKLGKNIGFDWTGYYKYRIKDHRTSIPRGQRGGKINIEHVITLQKQ